MREKIIFAFILSCTISIAANAELTRLSKENLVLNAANSHIWQDNIDAKSTRMNWDNAIAYCKTLHLAGFNDWELPEHQAFKDMVGNEALLKNNSNGYYWTARAYEKDSAWVVKGDTSYSTFERKRDSYNVRCIRTAREGEVENLTAKISTEETENGGDLIADPKSGCQVLNNYPEPGESITWSGSCKNKMATGNGTLQWYQNGKAGGRYEGNYQYGRMNGEGTYFYKSGNRYEGNYKNNKRSGRGTYTWTDGDYFTGEWLNDQMHGTGKEFHKDVHIAGEWRNDKNVQKEIVWRRPESSSNSSSVGSNNSYCGASDTCFEKVSAKGDIVTIRCTKGNRTGNTFEIRGPNGDGKWAIYGYSGGGYHHRYIDAGNFACNG